MAILKTNNANMAGRKRPRAVRFHNTVKHVTDTRRDIEQVRSTWLNKSELCEIKGAIKTDLQQLFSGRVEAIETSHKSWRGLETFTRRSNKLIKHRRERRAFLAQGVKDLQQRLKAEGLSAEKAISKLCKIASKQSATEAQTQAAQDSLDANQIYLETFLVPNVEDKLAELPPVVVANDNFASQQQLVTARMA